MFVVNLAVSDFCMMLTQAWPVIINAFTQRYWMWGKLGCQLYGATGAITGVCSILTMVAIGFDRYNVIVKGFSGTKVTSAKAFLILLLIWAYAVGICCGPFFGWGAYKTEGTLISCAYDFISPVMETMQYCTVQYSTVLRTHSFSLFRIGMRNPSSCLPTSSTTSPLSP